VLTEYIWNCQQALVELDLRDNEVEADAVSALLRCFYNHPGYPYTVMLPGQEGVGGRDAPQVMPLLLHLSGNHNGAGTRNSPSPPPLVLKEGPGAAANGALKALAKEDQKALQDEVEGVSTPSTSAEGATTSSAARAVSTSTLGEGVPTTGAVEATIPSTSAEGATVSSAAHAVSTSTFGEGAPTTRAVEATTTTSPSDTATTSTYSQTFLLGVALLTWRSL